MRSFVQEKSILDIQWEAPLNRCITMKLLIAVNGNILIVNLDKQRIQMKRLRHNRKLDPEEFEAVTDFIKNAGFGLRLLNDNEIAIFSNPTQRI